MNPGNKDTSEDGSIRIDTKDKRRPVAENHSSEKNYKIEIVWRNIIYFASIHIGALFGLYCEAKWLTWIWCLILMHLSAIGLTGGAHRLWSHKSYKAKTPLKIILLALNCISFQGDVISWVKDHRVHHKYAETDADPHNASRGFFFAHIGWLFVRKHPEVIEKGKRLDASDFISDPLLVFQRKYYTPLTLLFSFIVPIVVPLYWGESIYASFTITLVRQTLFSHITFCVNSVSHLWGFRPYDAKIMSCENGFISILTNGEGWHNYHHTFPYDYRASEFYYLLNPTTAFIDLFSAIGWAYDRKIVSKEIIEKQKLKHGKQH